MRHRKHISLFLCSMLHDTYPLFFSETHASVVIFSLSAHFDDLISKKCPHFCIFMICIICHRLATVIKNVHVFLIALIGGQLFQDMLSWTMRITTVHLPSPPMSTSTKYWIWLLAIANLSLLEMQIIRHNLELITIKNQNSIKKSTTNFMQVVESSAIVCNDNTTLRQIERMIFKKAMNKCEAEIPTEILK